MWQFEYAAQYEDRTEILKYDNQSPARDEVWAKADALGKVVSMKWRIFVDGKLFREGDMVRHWVAPTHEETMAYLDRTWKKASTP